MFLSQFSAIFAHFLRFSLIFGEKKTGVFSKHIICLQTTSSSFWGKTFPPNFWPKKLLKAKQRFRVYLRVGKNDFVLKWFVSSPWPK
jgi:hypothetical protein